jgi:hypothetical protein
MTQEQRGGKGAASAKGGGGDRQYMSDFASGRADVVCQSCGYSMRRPDDFGSEADGTASDTYCSTCYAEGSFRHEASSSDEFISLAVQDIAKTRKQAVGKMRLTLRKELPKLARWSA